MVKSKVLTIILSLMLLSPVFANPEIMDNENINSVPNEEEVVIQEETQTSADTINLAKEELKQPSELNYKQPVSRRTMAKKFLYAMLAVVVSSLALFVILSLYNCIREIFGNGMKNKLQNGEPSLETPDNLTDAVKTFLDKTTWS